MKKLTPTPVHQILVSAIQLKALSVEEVKQVQDTLVEAGVLAKGGELVGSEDIEPTVEANFIGWDPLKDICNAACDVAAASAAAACAAGTSGAGLAVCMAAVEVARQECRKHC